MDPGNLSQSSYTNTNLYLSHPFTLAMFSMLNMGKLQHSSYCRRCRLVKSIKFCCDQLEGNKLNCCIKMQVNYIEELLESRLKLPFHYLFGSEDMRSRTFISMFLELFEQSYLKQKIDYSCRSFLDTLNYC